MALPVCEVEFDREGRVHDPAQAERLLAEIAANGATDLLVVSHGWNNDLADARGLYAALLAELETVLAAHPLPSRVLHVLEVFWPSKRFTDADLIPGGGAASAGEPERDASIDRLLDGLEKEPLRLGVEAPVSQPQREAIARARALVARLEDDAEARREFVECVRSLLSRDAAHPDDGSTAFFDDDPADIVRRLGKPVSTPALGGDEGGAAALDAGGAAGLRDLFRGAKAAARRLLNFATYYRMKERAGVVGSTGVAEVVRRAAEQHGALRCHLVGHSFGGRLVTAAAEALGPAVPVSSLVLLQAAYSHNGLGTRFNGVDDGFFRRVVSEHKVSGPIVITHTRNDRAVGLAYPLASRVAGQDAAGFGEADDPYGGMGRNGAQHTPEASDGAVQAVGGPYAFEGGRVYNLNADGCIPDHNGICVPEVAYAIRCAVAAA